MKGLRGFAPYKNRVGMHLQNRMHSQNVCFAHVLECGYEGPVCFQPLVPPPELDGKCSRYKDFVDRGVVADQRKSPGEFARITGKQAWPVGVPEIPDPVRHAEMAQIGDRGYLLVSQCGEGLVGKIPVIPVRARVSGKIRRPVAQMVDVEFLQQTKVIPPPFVVPGFFHFILTDGLTLPLDGGIAVLYSGSKYESGY